MSADTGRGHRARSAASRRLSQASCPPAAGPSRNQRSPTASGWGGGARPSLIQEPGPLKQHTGRTAQGLSRAAAGTTDLAARPPDLAVQRDVLSTTPSSVRDCRCSLRADPTKNGAAPRPEWACAQLGKDCKRYAFPNQRLIPDQIG